MDNIIKQYIQASNKLINDGYYRQSINLTWIAFRLSLFKWLKDKRIPYNSTKEAILKILHYFENDNISTSIWYLETISTLSEWDEDFKINITIAKKFNTICYSIMECLAQKQ